MSSPMDQFRKSKRLVIALEKTASALANRNANTRRNGKASAIPIPMEAMRPPVRRASGRPRSGNAARRSAPPATIRPTTTRPRMTRRSAARRVSGTPANETTAIVTRTNPAGMSYSRSMRSTRSAGRNAKITAAGAIHRSSGSMRARFHAEDDDRGDADVDAERRSVEERLGQKPEEQRQREKDRGRVPIDGSHARGGVIDRVVGHAPIVPSRRAVFV